MMLNDGQKYKWILLKYKTTILLKVVGYADSFNPRYEGKKTGTNLGHFYFSLQIPEDAMELLCNIK